MSDGGKGSAPRPYSVKQEKFASNWDSVFGKKKPAYEADDGALTDEQLQQIKDSVEKNDNKK
tara:strand:- start:16218 stop:16403 length:186 start_codon:yes stop_codon:yes gene_type:complete